MQTTKPNKKLLSTIMLTLMTLSLFLAVIPVAYAADLGNITYTRKLEVGGVGTAVWYTGYPSVTTWKYKGFYSALLSTTAGVGDWAAVSIPVKIKLNDIDLDATYFYCRSTAGTYIPVLSFEILGDFSEYETDAAILTINNFADSAAASDGYLGFIGAFRQFEANATAVGTTWHYVFWDAGRGYLDGGADDWEDLVDEFGSKYVTNVRVILENGEVDTAYVDDAYVNGVKYALEPIFVGDVITVSGTGGTPGGEVKVAWDSISNVKATTTASSVTPYGWQATFTVPEDVVGSHGIVIKDVESSTTAATTITIYPKLTLTPDKGLVGDTISLKGTGFLDSSHINIWSTKWPTTLDGEVETSPTSVSSNTLGSFTCTFKIPTEIDEVDMTNGGKTIYAYDEDDNIGFATLTIGPYITVTPTKGYMETTVTVKGRGFTTDPADETVDIRWYKSTTPSEYVTVVDDLDIGSDGSFTVTFEIPLVTDPVAPGTEYTVQAIDSYDPVNIKPTATFTVIKAPKIVLDPKSGEVGDEVEVTGEWFTASKKVTMTFGTAALTTSPSSFTTETDGSFICTFDVPDVAEGSYTVKATDESGVSATYTFKVILAVTVIKTRATKYMQGDIVSVYGNCTEAPEDTFLVITDPEGVLFDSIHIEEGDWIQDEDTDMYTLPYFFTSEYWEHLPADASLGTWNFTAYETWDYYDGGEDILDSNLFTVVASSMQTILDRLDTINAKIVAIDADVATIKTDVGTIKVDVAAIKPVVTAIDGNVATIKTDVGTIKGQIVTIVADVATVKTDVGTVKASVASIATTATGTKTAADATKAALDGMTTIIYVAVIFSLIAAIAAAFSVYQINKKIAG